MTGMHLTLRELQLMVFDKRSLAICVTAAFICTVAAPFGTGATPVPMRALYWTLCIFSASVMSTAIITSAHRSPALDILPLWAKSPVGALAFALLYAGVLVALTRLFFGNRPSIPGYVELFLYAAPIAVAVAVIVDLFRAEEAPQTAASPSDRFFKRLKPALGRDLVCLSMQDHYLEVKTKLGAQLVLMRFSDALEELTDQPGWRIHRSHWVAEGGVANIRREGGKTFIVTTDDAELPVSRTYLPALRESALFKRFS